MSDYWLSTQSPLLMWRPEYQNVSNDAFLRENAGIDAALLAADLGLHETAVHAYQRKLGLRERTSPNAKRNGPAKGGLRPGQWTPEDLARLAELYPVLSNEDLVRAFHPRPLSAIRSQAWAHKIKKVVA